jgi:hypothetical protein
MMSVAAQVPFQQSPVDGFYERSLKRERERGEEVICNLHLCVLEQIRLCFSYQLATRNTLGSTTGTDAGT